MRAKILLVLFTACLLLISGNVCAQENVVRAVWVPEDVKKAPFCLYCAMDRTKFAHSRMLVTYDDGTKVGICSIHCLAVDLINNINKTPMVIEVGDYVNKVLIDAEKAYWVIGGNKPGVMTTQGKWAFANRVYAERFIRDHGGTLATFDEAMQAAYESMYTHAKMIREKRKIMKMEKIEQKQDVPQEETLNRENETKRRMP
jgi:copper chaperone NosL